MDPQTERFILKSIHLGCDDTDTGYMVITNSSSLFPQFQTNGFMKEEMNS